MLHRYLTKKAIVRRTQTLFRNVKIKTHSEVSLHYVSWSILIIPAQIARRSGIISVSLITPEVPTRVN